MFLIKMCENCMKSKTEWNAGDIIGFFEGFIPSNNTCPYCNNSLIDIEISYEDFVIIKSISKDVSFIQAMVELREKDPIEYQLKMTQFKANLAQQKVEEQKIDNTPHCPTCGSTNIEKISATSKVMGAVAFGLFSKTARSQFKCKNCGAKW